MTEEAQKRFLLLLASTYLVDDVKKKRVLDFLTEKDWVCLKSDDLVMKDKPRELVWRNNFAFVKKHLSMAGYYVDQVYDTWAITDKGFSYLLELFENIHSEWSKGQSFRWVTDRAINDTPSILGAALAENHLFTESGSARKQTSGRKRRRTSIVPSKTEQLAIIKARYGHVYFKNKLLEQGNACRLCGLTNRTLLIASHIKPWAHCEPEERLTPDNGFLLCTMHDSLFDKYLISFDDDGSILLSERLTALDRELLHLTEDMRILLNKGNLPYLKWHRNHFAQLNAL